MAVITPFQETKSVILLAICWAWTFSIATLLTFAGPKAAKNLKDDDFYAVFTVGIFVIGNAVCNIPSGPIFHRYGRNGGFYIGTLHLLLGGGLGAIAIAVESLGLLFFASFVIGVGVGFGQFYRFAAIELATIENKGWAVTTVLMGGCVAAFTGPTMGLMTKDMFNAEYAGGYFMIVIFALLNLFTIYFVEFPPEGETVTSDPNAGSNNNSNNNSVGAFQGTISMPKGTHGTISSVTINPVTASVGNSSSVLSATDVNSALNNTNSDNEFTNSTNVGGFHSSRERYLEIFKSRTFVNSTIISAISQIIMIIIMVCSILKMNDVGFTLLQQTLVLDFHFFSMFGTGFITHYILKTCGVYNAIIIAWCLIGLSLVFFLSTKALFAFFIGDFLVGVGWNIMFSTGTVMLSYCYLPHERHTVQAVYEIFINSISGVFTIVSGFILSAYGWDRVLYGVLGIYGALTITAPVYAQFYADPSSNFEDKRVSIVQCDPYHIAPEQNSAKQV